MYFARLSDQKQSNEKVELCTLAITNIIQKTGLQRFKFKSTPSLFAKLVVSLVRASFCDAAMINFNGC